MFHLLSFKPAPYKQLVKFTAGGVVFSIHCANRAFIADKASKTKNACSNKRLHIFIVKWCTHSSLKLAFSTILYIISMLNYQLLIAFLK